ncbi:PAS domain S-box protein, partial [Anaerosalibacter bizertensis]|nr:PAS domain S-box protein [Anaerosalibacter bizertensis]
MKKKDYNEIILQNILQHGDIGIHAIDNNKKTIVYNGAMSKLEGLKEETVINRDLLEIFPSLDEESSTLINVMRTGQSIINRTQTYLNLKGQKIVTVNSTLPLIHKGKIVGALEIAKNVTHIKKLSDQLIDLQNELNINNKEKQNKTIKKYKFK